MSNPTKCPSSLIEILEYLQEKMPELKITDMSNLNPRSNFCEGTISGWHKISFHYYSEDGSLVVSMTADFLHVVDHIIGILIVMMGYPPFRRNGTDERGNPTATFIWDDDNRM